jgi:hypothetical protein
MYTITNVKLLILLFFFQFLHYISNLVSRRTAPHLITSQTCRLEVEFLLSDSLPLSAVIDPGLGPCLLKALVATQNLTGARVLPTKNSDSVKKRKHKIDASVSFQDTTPRATITATTAFIQEQHLHEPGTSTSPRTTCKP